MLIDAVGILTKGKKNLCMTQVKEEITKVEGSKKLDLFLKKNSQLKLAKGIIAAINFFFPALASPPIGNVVNKTTIREAEKGFRGLKLRWHSKKPFTREKFSKNNLASISFNEKSTGFFLTRRKGPSHTAGTITICGKEFKFNLNNRKKTIETKEKVVKYIAKLINEDKLSKNDVEFHIVPLLKKGLKFEKTWFKNIFPENIINKAWFKEYYVKKNNAEVKPDYTEDSEEIPYQESRAS